MSFDRLAPHYRWLETVVAGEVLQRARLAHLAKIDRAESVLLVGEGPGRFLQALRARRPKLAIAVVDASEAMLAQARRAAPQGPTEFIAADLCDWSPPSARWDAAVTHCFLDCFDPPALAEVMATLSRALRPQAEWLISDFALPPRGWRRQRARALHAMMYRAFRLTTRLPARRWTDPTPFLRANGFTLRTRQSFNHGLIHADHWGRD